MRIRTLSIAVVLVAALFVGLWTGRAWLKTLGVLDPANPPESTSSSTLEDIYIRLIKNPDEVEQPGEAT